MSEHGKIFTRPDRRGVFGDLGDAEDRRRAQEEAREQERKNRAFINRAARPSETNGKTGHTPDVQELVNAMRRQLAERYEKTGSIVDTGLPARPVQAGEAETGKVIEMPRQRRTREGELGEERRAA